MYEVKKISIFYLLLILFNVKFFSQTFTIAVIPDTQNYTDYRYQLNSNPPHPYNFSDVYRKQVKLILDGINNGEYPIIFAIHLGDNVLHQNSQISEWDLAEEIISGLDYHIPYGMVPGNHDYDSRVRRKDDFGNEFWSFEGDTFFKKYFGATSKHFVDKSWYVDFHNDGMNSAIIFNYKKHKFLFIGLEMEAGDEALRWAQDVINRYKGLPTIVATHEFLSAHLFNGNVVYTGSHYRRLYDSNTPKNIWNKFITKNSQIFMVLNGHSYDGSIGERIKIDVNDAGYPVYQMLSDYEGRIEMFEEKELNPLKYGGDGWMRLLEFNLNKNEIHVRTYSPELEKFELDADSDFVLQFSWDWNERFELSNLVYSDK